MAGVTAVPYEAEHRAEWDAFVDGSRNGTFLFRRDYMDYHADRFTDASLLLHTGDKLVAVIPASVSGDVVTSHGGLTYGGVVSGQRMSTPLMLEVFDAVLAHLTATGVSRLVYKVVPHIYHVAPAEEDLYALFRHGARLVRRDLSSSLRMAERLPLRKGRKRATKRVWKNAIAVVRSYDFHGFMAMETALLETKYGTQPVHTGDEMARLAERFPENIKLFLAEKEGCALAGTIIYETPVVAHAQYIASTEKGRELSAADRLFALLLDEVFADKRYFDFGISTEDEGQTLNLGLVYNKESWGARATVCDSYELTVARSF